jgi:hypothetical protein
VLFSDFRRKQHNENKRDLGLQHCGLLRLPQLLLFLPQLIDCVVLLRRLNVFFKDFLQSTQAGKPRPQFTVYQPFSAPRL